MFSGWTKTDLELPLVLKTHKMINHFCPFTSINHPKYNTYVFWIHFLSNKQKKNCLLLHL